MSNGQRNVDSIMIRTDRPTELTLSDLYTWVIWQFPRPKGDGFCGAVKPPIANHSWFPALIRSRASRVLVYGHIDKEFTHPQDAADWLESAHP